MATIGDTAVLRYSGTAWVYDIIAPGNSSIISFGVSGLTGVTSIGSSVGNIPSVKLPLSVMDLTMTPPMRATGNVVSVDVATTSAAGVMSAADKTKLDGTPSSFATVATTGVYSDLTGKPTIPSAQINSDWNASSGIAQILNKPSLATVATSGAYSDLSGRPTALSSFTNDSGYITSSALSPYLTSATAASTYVPLTRTVNGHALSADVTVTKSDVGLSVVENTALSTWTGSTSVTTLGTISTGTWSGTPIVDGKIASASTWNAKQNAITTGTTLQYLTGALSLATFPTAVSSFTNDSGYITPSSSSALTNKTGNISQWTNDSSYITQSGARSAISLTTTGSSGSATYNSSTGVLNVPTYANSGGTVTSIIAGTGLSGGTITSTGTISLPNTGTAGTYSGITTDTQGRVTAGTARSFANASARSISTTNNSANGFQLSTAQDAAVTYPVTISTTATIGGPSSGTILLEICATNNATGAAWTTINTFTNNQTITLAVVLQSIQAITHNVAGIVPAGWFARVRSIASTGTVTYSTSTTGQEVLL